MKHRHAECGTILVSIMLLFFSCSEEADDNTFATGGSTETIGVLYYEDGTVASGAKVRFVPSDFNSDTTVCRTSIEEIASDGLHCLDSVVTDEEGHFTLPELPDGTYNYIYEWADLRGRRQNIVIEQYKTSEVVQDTLHRGGTFSGVVQLTHQDNHKNILILVVGSNIYKRPTDSLGNFELPSMAAGRYQLKILTPNSSDYAIVDTTIEIIAGKISQWSDTLKIPYIGIPTPENVSITYNPMLLKATLRWDKVISEDFGGYRIYRKEDIPGAVVDHFDIKDTFFIDSCNGNGILQGNSYLYSVRAISADVFKDGEGSEPVGVTYHSSYDTLQNFSLELSKSEEVVTSLTTDSQGMLYFTSSNSSVVNSFNPIRELSEELVTVPLSVEALGVDMMADSSYLVATENGLLHFGQPEQEPGWYNIKGKGIKSVERQYIYYITSKGGVKDNTLMVFNINSGNDPQIVVQDKSRKISSFAIFNHTLFILWEDYNSIVLEQSSQLAYLPEKEYILPRRGGFSDLVVTGKYIYLLANNEIHCLSEHNLNLMSRTAVLEETFALEIASDSTLYTLDQQGILCHIASKKVLTGGDADVY